MYLKKNQNPWISPKTESGLATASRSSFGPCFWDHWGPRSMGEPLWDWDCRMAAHFTAFLDFLEVLDLFLPRILSLNSPFVAIWQNKLQKQNLNFLKDIVIAGQIHDIDMAFMPCIWLEIIVWCKKGTLLIKDYPVVPNFPMTIRRFDCKFGSCRFSGLWYIYI